MRTSTADCPFCGESVELPTSVQKHSASHVEVVLDTRPIRAHIDGHRPWLETEPGYLRVEGMTDDH